MRKNTWYSIFILLILILILFFILFLKNRAPECAYLTPAVIEKVTELNNSGETVVFREGYPVREDDFFIFATPNMSFVFEAAQIYNNTGVDYTNDEVKIEDVLIGDVYSTIFISEGEGILILNGIEHKVNLLCDPYFSCWVTFDYYPFDIEYDYTSCYYGI